MVLPAETEERVKRKALNTCSDNLRKVVDVSRKIPQIIEYFSSGDKENAKKLLVEIREGKAAVVESRRMVSQELAEIGAILISREDFLRFTNLSSEIADFSEGIAFYLTEIMEHDWVVSADIKTDLANLSSAVLDVVLKLRETMMVLNYGSQKALERAKDVETAESIVDELYRVLTIKVLSSKLDTPVLFLLRDILQMLENSADKAEDAADTARMLSMVM
ncbi:MAG: DUF47 family protein [Nitrososphaerota archaeon]|nr:DUF47 family protein [Nitrososphaerota archaeon]